MSDEDRLEKLRLRSAVWRATHPERAREIARTSGKKARDAKAIAEGREPGRLGKAPWLTDEERRANRQALTDAGNARKKLRDAEKAITEGREPGRVGRPPILTTEEKEESRVKQNRRRSLRTNVRIKARRAAKAIAEGRVPGVVGGPRRLTDEERAAAREASFAKYRAEHIDEIRAYQADRRRAKTAARALAEGRVPGVLGRLASFTSEDLAAYLERWPRDKDVYHHRIQAQNSRAKRLGIPGKLTAMDIREIYIEQMGHCTFCANPFGDEIPEIDHWIPFVRGGTNDRDNAKLLHMRCNRTKGGKHPDDLGLIAKPSRKKRKV